MLPYDICSFVMIIANLLDSFAEELRAKRKKQLKKDTASKLKSQVDEVIKAYFTISYHEH